MPHGALVTNLGERHDMLHRLLFEMRCLELGILPEHIFKDEIAWNTIDENDARKMRRKYRKLRRKLQKKSKRKVKHNDVFHQIKMEVWSKMTE